MPISPFIAGLREKIGNDLLHLPCVSAVVLNDRAEVLLVQAKNSERWETIGGTIEPGEEPADAAAREVFEESGVRAVPQHLVGAYDGPSVVYSNGDRVQCVTIVFLMKAISGQPHAHDDENVDARYFPVGNLPQMRSDHRRNITDALANRREAFGRESLRATRKIEKKIPGWWVLTIRLTASFTS